MSAVTMVEFGKLPAVQVEAPDGAQAIITLYGAQLVSWKGADGRERLFCSAHSALDGGKAIRGGVPVIFPQFGERGHGLRHGFARVSNWRLGQTGIQDGAAFASLALTRADLPHQLSQAWPYDFTLVLRIGVRAGELEFSLDLRNSGADAFPFAAALHSYYLVDQIDEVRIDGLKDTDFEDAAGDGTQREALLAIGDKIDRVYRAVRGALTVSTGAGTLRLVQSGFTDAVVWNPGAADAAALSDLGDDEYRRFVCIEPALIVPQLLQPGGQWQGQHRVLLSDES